MAYHRFCKVFAASLGSSEADCTYESASRLTWQQVGFLLGKLRVQVQAVAKPFPSLLRPFLADVGEQHQEANSFQLALLRHGRPHVVQRVVGQLHRKNVGRTSDI